MFPLARGIEAPVIVLLATSTAHSRNLTPHRRLRRSTHVLGGAHRAPGARRAHAPLLPDYPRPDRRAGVHRRPCPAGIDDPPPLAVGNRPPSFPPGTPHPPWPVPLCPDRDRGPARGHLRRPRRGAPSEAAGSCCRRLVHRRGRPVRGRVRGPARATSGEAGSAPSRSRRSRQPEPVAGGFTSPSPLPPLIFLLSRGDGLQRGCGGISRLPPGVPGARSQEGRGSPR